MKILSSFKDNWEKIILAIALLAIFITNYIPGSWLIGWDNLVPELNIWANLKRSVFAVWQEYQGLGLVGGMGHATDIIRQLIILPLTYILPTNIIRYLCHFSMIVLGTFGTYNFLKNLLKLKKTPSFLGSLFYLLNFGTIQIFWPPFESFTNFWGFFPWLIYSFLTLLKKQDKKSWRRFLIVNILAIPCFYLQTVFVVYILSLVCFWTAFLIANRKEKIKKTAKPFFIILFVNLFWLLPFGYFLATSLQNPTLAKMNQMTSEETFLRNQNRGNIADFALLRGYYYDFPDGEIPLMAVWHGHFSRLAVLVIGYSLSILVAIGLGYYLLSFKKRKNPILIGTFFIFFLCTIALLSATPPFSWLNYLLRQSPFINQVFRSPFTKFIVPTAFTFSIFFALGTSFITSKIKKLNKYVAIGFCLVTLSLMLFYSLPVFRGNFIYSRMKVELPQQYLQLINYFKEKPKTARIANLPQGNFWGWTFYRWGYRGSGFLWYGIEQPIVDRAFDVWSLKNEAYYNDINYALQNQDLNLLETIFDKYLIEYVIFDDNVYYPGEKVYAQQALTTKQLLEKSSRLKKVKGFDNISVYQFDKETSPYLTNSIADVYLPNKNNYQILANLSKQVPLENSELKRCNTTLAGVTSMNKVNQQGTEFIRLESIHDDACLAWWLSDLNISQGWQVEVTYRSVKGHPPLVSAHDGQENYKFFHDKLKVSKDWQTVKLVIPAYNTNQKGIAFSFSSISYNQFPSVNDISKLAFTPIVFDNLLANNSLQRTSIETKSNIWIHKSFIPENIANLNKRYLVLPQSYDKGWLAFYFDKNKLTFFKNHILINNWANGWETNSENLSEKTVYFVFWPQILEFVGFISLFSVFIWVFTKKSLNKH